MLTFLLVKNQCRRGLRYIKEKKWYFIVYFPLTLFLCYWLLTVFFVFFSNYLRYGVMLVYIYEIAKILQKAPTFNIPIQIIQYKLFSQTKYKIYILFKCFGASFVVVAIYIALIIYHQDNFVILQEILILCLLNFIVNVNCFFKSQFLNFRIVVVIITTLEILFLALFPYIVITLFITLFSFLAIVFLKRIKLDVLLPFYLFMSLLGEGLSKGDVNKIFDVQNSFKASKKNRFTQLLINNYGKTFCYYKELKRILNNYAILINSFIINVVIIFMTLLFLKESWRYGVAMSLALIVTENILSTLNKKESLMRTAGFYLPFTIREWVRQKYCIHLLVTVVVILPTMFLIEQIGIIIYFFCVALLPLKNILYHFFAKNLKNKIFIYLLNFIIFSLCFLNYTIHHF